MSLSSTATATANPWVRILSALEKKINRHSFETWLKPTRYSHAEGELLGIRVPTAEFRNIGEKYADLIQEAIDGLDLGFTDVKYMTQEELTPAPPVRADGGFGAVGTGATGAAAPGARPGSQVRFDWDG